MFFLVIAIYFTEKSSSKEDKPSLMSPSTLEYHENVIINFIYEKECIFKVNQINKIYDGEHTSKAFAIDIRVVTRIGTKKMSTG